ncbi:cation-chloride cotransporter 1-like [Pyrus ussuriensis x Pyrus communis]|uniref:Cation-chloride cotransporter 1-like n=1 Tax=Pyrus ussuriensis x Pyrus communis TaxID=2448454 RepID=A0A5N5IAF9_9ROSA|nr:cation-chloride cotransporter 1-like [Pyrus ussuriensis x Pyrus communis]
MDNADVEAGAEEEFRGQMGRKYRPVVDDDRAVLEMSSMDPSSSSSSSSSLPVHQASLKYVRFLYLRLRDLNGG